MASSLEIWSDPLWNWNLSFLFDDMKALCRKICFVEFNIFTIILYINQVDGFGNILVGMHGIKFLKPWVNYLLNCLKLGYTRKMSVQFREVCEHSLMFSSFWPSLIELWEVLDKRQHFLLKIEFFNQNSRVISMKCTGKRWLSNRTNESWMFYCQNRNITIKLKSWQRGGSIYKIPLEDQLHLFIWNWRWYNDACIGIHSSKK